MQHVDEGLLTAYADGQLDASSARHIEAHVQACVECQTQLAEIQRTSEQARAILAMPGVTTPAFAEVLARAGRRRVPSWYRPLAWAASLVIVTGTGWYLLRDRAPATPANTAIAATPTSSPAAPPPGRGEQSHAGPAARQIAGALKSTSSGALGGAGVTGGSAGATAEQRALVREPVRAADVQLASEARRSASGAGAAAPVESMRPATPPPAAPAPFRTDKAASPTAVLDQLDSVSARSTYVIDGLPIVSQGAPVGGPMRTMQQLDSTHTVELTQELASSRAEADSVTTRADLTLTTVVIVKGRYRITARAAVPEDSLRALLRKLK